MIIYLHGFNSSPGSHKASWFGRWLAECGLADEYACPALPTRPLEAISTVEALMAARRAAKPGTRFTFLGSSLGGFYATWLADRHDANAVLVNPAVDPHIGLRAYLGLQQNLYTAEKWTLTEEHLDQWQVLYLPVITPSRYLLLVETGDEVLDYRRAVARYAGAQQVVVQGGDHSLRSFPEQVGRILEFAGLAAAT